MVVPTHNFVHFSVSKLFIHDVKLNIRYVLAAIFMSLYDSLSA